MAQAGEGLADDELQRPTVPAAQHVQVGVVDLRERLLVHRSQRLHGEHLDQPANPLELVLPGLVRLRIDAGRRIEVAPLDARLVGHGEERLGMLLQRALSRGQAVDLVPIGREARVRDGCHLVGERRLRPGAGARAPPDARVLVLEPLFVDAPQRGSQQLEALLCHPLGTRERGTLQRFGQAPQARRSHHGLARIPAEHASQQLEGALQRRQDAQKPLASIAGNLLQVVELVADGRLSQRGGRRRLGHLGVERAEDLDRLGNSFVLQVVGEVAHGAPVQILQRLEPVDVGVVDLPQQLLRVLLDAVAIRRELQQDLLLLRDHHVDRRASEVHLERIGVRALQQRPRTLGARLTGQHVRLAGVVPQQAREQR